MEIMRSLRIQRRKHSSIQPVVLVFTIVLAIVTSKLCCSSQQELVVKFASDTQRCAMSRVFVPDFGCNYNNNNQTTTTTSSSLIIQFPSFGRMECGQAYTLQESNTVPNITFSSAEIDTYYTILLIDTSDSSVHPIQHYGAVNVPGTLLREGVNVSSVGATTNENNNNLNSTTRGSVFYPFRGPSPPFFLKFLPRQRRQLFPYEWIVAKQMEQRQQEVLSNGTIIMTTIRPIPIPDSAIRVDYKTNYLVGTTVVATSYFQSGFCVRSS